MTQDTQTNIESTTGASSAESAVLTDGLGVDFDNMLKNGQINKEDLNMWFTEEVNRRVDVVFIHPRCALCDWSHEVGDRCKTL